MRKFNRCIHCSAPINKDKGRKMYCDYCGQNHEKLILSGLNSLSSELKENINLSKKATSKVIMSSAKKIGQESKNYADNVLIRSENIEESSIIKAIATLLGLFIIPIIYIYISDNIDQKRRNYNQSETININQFYIVNEGKYGKER